MKRSVKKKSAGNQASVDAHKKLVGLQNGDSQKRAVRLKALTLTRCQNQEQETKLV